VVPGGDYGFKFRFGRNGLHPYEAWNGELPGTLPMICGVGEAASALMGCDRTGLPTSYREALLVTAGWDHRIEVVRPKPFGASLRSEAQVLVQGGESFRPIALATAPDGAVFFTDWVDASYNVHGKGRIWKLQNKEATKPGSLLALKPNAERRRMNELADGKLRGVLVALADKDPFVRSAAVTTLSQPVLRDEISGELKSLSADTRLGVLLALRRGKVTNDAPAVLDRLLADPDARVRQMALVWAGEQAVVSLTNRIGAALKAGPVTPALLRIHAATEQILTKAAGLKKTSSGDEELAAFDFAERADETRAVEVLRTRSPVPLSARLDAVRDLAQTTNSAGIVALRRIAASKSESVELRCEAVLALAGDGSLLPLLDDSAPAVRVEAARVLRALLGEQRVRDAFTVKRKKLSAGREEESLREQLYYALQLAGDEAASMLSPMRPESDEEWRTSLKPAGDAASGRRVFFNPSLGCARCHRIEDRGGRLGPDLSTIARGADREKLMQSILHPSRDIAPQFVSHTVETKDGQSLTGLLSSESTDGTVTLLTADGKAVRIPGAQVTAHTQSKVSLMPEGLEKGMTVGDFRDLMVFLLSRK
jgi:putative heme-binding domain-containing protein